MELVELGSVPLDGSKRSTVKGEYVLISLVRKYRSILNSHDYGLSQLSKWGVLCFVLMLIVIHGEGVSLQYITECFSRSKLHTEEGKQTESDDEDDDDDDARLIKLKEQLKPILQSLVMQRMLEVVKRVPEQESEPSEATNDSDTYYIGPHTPHIIKGRELYQIIIKIAFPFEDTKSSEFQEKYKVLIRDLVRKINATCLDPTAIPE